MSSQPFLCRSRRHPSSEDGVTLIEVLVSALLVALLAAAAATALVAGSHFSGNQRYRAQADQILVQDQERLRGLPDEQLAGLNQTRTVTMPSGAAFTVTSTANFVDTTGASSCTQTAISYYKTTSTVSFSGGSSGSASLRSESLLSRPVGGGLLVQITDQTLTPLAGVSVSASGPSPQSASSDAAGCVAFAGLTPGSYTTTMSAPGWVDPDGDPTYPNATATVTSNGVAQPNGFPFHLGLAGRVKANFATQQGHVGEADAISWTGAGAILGMSNADSTLAATAPTSTVQQTITTAASLFPFDTTASPPASYNSNYTVWAGRCAGMQPPAGSKFGVSPGGPPGQGTVLEPELQVTNIYSGSTSTPVPPAHLLLSYTNSAGTCSYSWYPTIAQVTSMPASGWLLYPGQPYVGGLDKLTLCADYNNHKLTSSTFTNSSFTTPTVAPSLTIPTNGGSKGTC